MKKNQDAYGQMMLAQYHNRMPSYEIIERDDDFIDTGSEPGLYFLEYDDWSPLEKQAVEFAEGRILDVGCGAGRHSLYLQQKGFDVTGIDNSPGAIEVCKLRGLKKAIVRPVTQVAKFKPNSFDTIIMLGNNFGLFGSREQARVILREISRITSPAARIIAQSLDPYKTGNLEHLEYHKSNKKRGRMPGQIRLRVRFRRAIGEWFDYLFVSPVEMQDILHETEWRIEHFIQPEGPHFIAVIGKKSSPRPESQESH
jgi:SAM-dependent methyltransferase